MCGFFFISKMSISSPNPMLDHLLELSHRDDSKTWSNIGFGEEMIQVELTEVIFYTLYLELCILLYANSLYPDLKRRSFQSPKLFPRNLSLNSLNFTPPCLSQLRRLKHLKLPKLRNSNPIRFWNTFETNLLEFSTRILRDIQLVRKCRTLEVVRITIFLQSNKGQ